jgi:hypothetical protein
MRDVDDGLVIEDTRGDEAVTWHLSVLEAAIYRAISDISIPTKIAPVVGLHADEVRAILLQLVEQGLALQEGDHFLALALPPVEAETQFKRKIELHGFRRIAKPAAPVAARAEHRGSLPVLRS